MYPISDAFKKMLSPDGVNRTIVWYGSMTTEAGTVYDVNTNTISPGTGVLESSCALPFVGGAYSTSLQVQLNLRDVDPRTLENARIELYVRLYVSIPDSATWEDLTVFTWNDLKTVTWGGSTRMAYTDIPMGIFYVTKAERVLYSIKLEAYDGMLNFNADLPSMDNKSRSAFTWLRWACNACGVELGMTAAQVKALPNGSRSFIYADVDENVKTYRALLGKLAAVLGCIAGIDRTGRLVLWCCGNEWKYNGTLLPKLPKWNKKKYPYFAIFKYADVSYKKADYQIVAVTAPYFYSPVSGREHIGVTPGDRHVFHLSEDGMRWIDKGEITQPAETWVAMLELYDGHSVVWTNTDIPYINSTEVYMAASEPTYIAAEVTPSDRYSSEYEDTQSHYTGLWAQYKAQAKQEYYKNVSALEDAGLVMDLGVNPFLQISSDTSRAAAIQSIIDTFSGVTFTPFTVSIPCHPEYDLLDVLSFTGGHAPANCYAPITSITRQINGGVTIQCAVPEAQVSPVRETTQVDGLSGSGGTSYASFDFWIQIDFFPDAETTITEDTITTELTVNCTVDNTTMQIAWTGFYSLDAAATVTAKVFVDDKEIYTGSDDQTAGNHVLNVTTGHTVNTQGQRVIKVVLREDAL